MNKLRFVKCMAMGLFGFSVVIAADSWAAPVALKCQLDNGVTERITVDPAALTATMQSTAPGSDKLEIKDGATGPSLDHGGKAFADFVTADDTQYTFGRNLCTLAKSFANLPCVDSYVARVAINRLDGTMLLQLRDQKDSHGSCDKDDSHPKF